jgi:parallel beta-helix repeat protein
MDKKRILASAVVSVLLFSALAGAQLVRLAEANFFPMQIPQPAFIIRSNGSVDPSTAPIQRDGNVYTFTADIVGYTVASERDNIVLDGGGFTLTGNGDSTGIFILNRNGITVRNMKVSNFSYGIRLIADIYLGGASSSNSLINNTVTDNDHGIVISSSSDNVLRNNVMSNNTRNFGVQGRYAQDVDASNTVDGKPVIYWVDQQYRTVPSDTGYVALVNCTGVTVQGLNLADNGEGIVLVSTADSAITANHVTSTGTGIYIQGSSGNTISSNNVTRNDYGIRGQASSNNSMSSNYITNNEKGIYVTGDSENNVISKNSVAANTEDGIYLSGPRNTTIDGNTVANNTENGIIFFESQNNRIVNNAITGNGNGIKLWFGANNNNASGNYIAKNAIGILIDDSFDNRIIRNMITENSDWGMQLTGSQNNNVIYHNSFVDNNGGEGLQVSIPGIWSMDGMKDGGGNVWDNGTAGNYWRDYLTRYPNATEIDGTGVGDTRFYINPNNYDRYPLMEPATIPEFPSWVLLCVMLVVMVVVAVVYRCNLNKHNQRTF